MRSRVKARPGRGRKLVGEAKNQKDYTSNSSDTRSLLSYLPKNFDSKGLFMVKAMLGKTRQGKKEVRALATSKAEQEARAILDMGTQATRETSSMR